VNRSAALLCALLALAVVLAPACKSSQPEPKWIKADVTAGNDRLLMDVTALSLQKTGFPIGSGIDPGQLTVVTGWNTSLAPFRGKGWREKCEVHYKKTADRKYEVSIRVQREKNDDILRPLDLTYAKWIPAEDNQERARYVLQHVRSLLGGDIQISEKR